VTGLTVPRMLARRSMGVGAAVVFAVGSSAPMVVLYGAIPQMYGKTAVVGVPLSYAVIAVVLGLLASGYVAMSNHLKHPAPFYAFLGRGLGPTAGMAGAAVALLSYNCIQISLYGLIGTTFAGELGGSWQAWAWGAWVVVAVVGFMGGAFTARVLGCFLAVEIAIIVVFVLTGLAHRSAGTPMFTGLSPAHLLQPGVSGVLAFAMASFVGIESPAVFAEEGRPHAVGRAVAVALAGTGILYLLAATAYEDWAGVGQVAAAAGDSNRQPFALLGAVFGPSVTLIATVLLGTSALASMSAFHAAAARYTFGMAREGVLPAGLLRVSRAGEVARGGAPTGGSVLQSALAGLVLTVVMVTGADPMAILFSWLSTIASVGILALLVATAVASLVWFARGDAPKLTAWTRVIAPGTGAVLGVLVLSMMVYNLSGLLGLPPGSQLGWLVLGIVVGIALAGMVWGLLLRAWRPMLWQGIGAGAPTGVLVRDDRLSQVRV
jgi:amino acid transporter